MLKFFLASYLLIELVCIVRYVANFGFLNFLGEVFLSAIIGFILLFKYGFLSSYSQLRVLNLKNLFSSVGLVFAGVLLILPGIMSDILAIFIIICSLILKIFDYFSTSRDSSRGDSVQDDIIDVEIVDEKESR